MVTVSTTYSFSNQRNGKLSLSSGKFGFDDHNSRNNSAGDERVVGTIVAVGHETRIRPDPSKHRKRSTLDGCRERNQFLARCIQYR